jgi:hypothetical protein
MHLVQLTPALPAWNLMETTTLVEVEVVGVALQQPTRQTLEMFQAGKEAVAGAQTDCRPLIQVLNQLLLGGQILAVVVAVELVKTLAPPAAPA